MTTSIITYNVNKIIIILLSFDIIKKMFVKRAYKLFIEEAKKNPPLYKCTKKLNEVTYNYDYEPSFKLLIEVFVWYNLQSNYDADELSIDDHEVFNYAYNLLFKFDLHNTNL